MHRLIAGRKHDVYIIQNLPMNLLPGDGARADLAAAVAAGAGLVLTDIKDGDSGLMKDKQAVDPLPSFLSDVPAIGAYNVGKGRMIVLPARPKLPYDVGWTVKYEYWTEQVGRAMIWAAGREPAMKLNLRLPAETVERGKLAGYTITLNAAGGPPEGTRCSVTLRRWDDQTTRIYDGDLKTGGKLELRLPALRAGSYHIDALASSPRGTEAWATASFEVTTAESVSVKLDWNTKFEDIHPEGKSGDWRLPWGEVGQRIRGELQAKLAGKQTARVRLMDHTGRILEQADLAQGKQTFDFAIEPWMPQLVRVEGVILEGGSEVAASYEWFLVPKRRQGRYNFVLWGPIEETLGEYAYKNLRDQGVTAILTNLDPDLAAAAYGMTWVPMTGGNVGLFGGADRWVTMGPPEKWDGWMANRIARTHGVLAYSLGDEGPVTGAGITPAAMDVYRNYLRKIYGDIAALNASWGTEFEGFEAVELSEPKDSNEDTARNAGNYPRWYDRQAFSRYNFVQHGRDHRLAMLPYDPHAKIGFEGSGRFARSADPDEVCRHLDMWVPYTHNIDEVIRSIAPRDFIRSNWTGYNWDADKLLSRYWRSIVLGADSMWWWMWCAIDPWRGFHAPDLKPFPETIEMLKDTRILHDGLGDLLIRSEMLDDGIAMLYSMPSSFAAVIQNGPTHGDYEAVNASWYTIINDIPMMYRYVTDGMIDRGEFKADRYRVLILPFAQAISDKTEAVIRKFAENGGTVIADIRPGVYDGRCKPLQKGRLDEFFGIEGPANTAAVKADINVDGKIGDREIKLVWSNAPVDPSLKTTTGQALGKATLPGAQEAPVFIVNNYGKGRAILLNLATSAFGGRTTGTGLTGLDTPEELDPKLWSAFNSIFGSAGATPAIRLALSRVNDDYMGNVRVQRWQNGDMQIFSLFRARHDTSKPSANATTRRRAIVRLMNFDKPYVYNLRAGLTLGEPHVWTEPRIYADVIPSRATFFAVLPGPAPEIQARLNKPSFQRGERISLQVGLPGAGRSTHAVKLEGFSPDGTAVEGWPQVMLTGATPVSVSLPVAHNDPAGVYRVTLTDVITRDTAVELRIEVN